MIELAAKVWKIPVELAVKRLIDHGAFSKKMNRVLVDDYLERFNRIVATQSIYDSNVDRVLHGAYQYKKIFQALNLNAGYVLQNEESRKCFFLLPTGKVFLGTLKKRPPKSYRIPDDAVVHLNKSVWKNSIALPYFDVPGRICGFRLYAYDRLRLVTGYSRVGTVLYERSDNESKSGGVFCYPDIWKHTNQFDTALAISDDALALRLIIKGLAKDPVPLPICSYMNKFGYDTPPAAWHVMGHNTKIVFWEPEITDKQLLAAILANGYISTHRVTELQEYFNKTPPEVIVKKLTKDAISWQQAFESYVKEKPAECIEELLRSIKLRGTSIHSILGLFDKKIQAKCVKILGVVQPYKKKDRLLAGSGKLLLRNSSGIPVGVFWINELVKYPELNKTYMSAQLKTKYDVVNVFEDFEKFVANPKAALERLCLLHSGSFPIIQRRPGTPTVLEILSDNIPPDIKIGYSRIGWHRDENKLVLPNFYINGTAFYKHDTPFIPKRVAASAVSIVGELPVNEVQMVCDDTPQYALAWHILTFAVATLLGSMFAERKCNLIIGYSRYSKQIPAIIRAINIWKNVKLSELKPKNDDWPLYSCVKPGNKPTARDCVKRGLILYAPIGIAAALAFNKGHITTLCEYETVDGSDPNLKLFPKIISAYLKDLAARNFTINQSKSWHESVRADISGWLKRYADREMPIDGLQILTCTSKELPGLWVDYTLHFLSKRRRTTFWRRYLRRSYAAKKKFTRVGSKVFVPHFKPRRSDTYITSEQVSDMLKRHNIPYLEERGSNSEVIGWWIDRNWWNAQKRKLGND